MNLRMISIAVHIETRRWLSGFDPEVFEEAKCRLEEFSRIQHVFERKGRKDL